MKKSYSPPIILVEKEERKVSKYITSFASLQNVKKSSWINLPQSDEKLVIEGVREMVNYLSLNRKNNSHLVIIRYLDEAKIETQNALLKILEDGSQYHDFLMVVGEIGSIIPTILSRSKVVRLEENTKENLDKLGINEFFSFDNEDKLIRDKYILDLDKITKYLVIKVKSIAHEESKIAHEAMKFCEEILRVRALLKKNNLSVKIAHDHLALIFIQKKLNEIFL